MKKAFESAEQEIQEKEIASLKGIIKNLLQKKADKEGAKREIEKEISVIKQTIDDFKEGRLDKVKEMIEKDDVAKSTLPFKIIIINQPVITKPWGWTYRVMPNNNYYDNVTTTFASGNGSIAYYNAGNTTTGFAGNTFAAMTAGTYSLDNGNNINL